MSDQEERKRADLTKALRDINVSSPVELELLALTATVAFNRYTTLVKAGFTSDQALFLCSKRIEL